MATFPRGHNARDTHRRNQRIVIGSVTTTITTGKVTWFLDPADALTLRGIPAIGRNVQGAIAGTRPDTRIPSDVADTLDASTSPGEA